MVLVKVPGEIGLLLAEGGEEEEEDVYREVKGKKKWRRVEVRVDGKRNGVGVILKEEYSKSVVEVKRVSDRVMNVKLEVEGVMINVISAYAPQIGCELEEKEKFWSELDEVMESVQGCGVK
ncbi:hypothetical protein HF521_005746, partial [Silurus meridionalis]